MMLKSPDRAGKTSHFTSLSEFRREQTLDGNKMAQHTVPNNKRDSVFLPGKPSSGLKQLNSLELG